MPQITHGIIEVMHEDMSWQGIVVIDALVGQVADITSILFDVDNRKAKEPIAARRGLPSNLSYLTDQLTKELEGNFFSETWITPEEIANVFQVKRLKAGWSMIFGFMNVLSEIYGEGKVRLVVWFTS